MCGNAMDTLPCRGGVFGCRVLKALANVINLLLRFIGEDSNFYYY